MKRVSRGSHSPGEMSNIARYTNGHLFDLYGAERTALVEQIGAKLGALSTNDYSNLDKFTGRVKHLSEVAHSRNCQLYVDAE